jgi:hypothetical protein
MYFASASRCIVDAIVRTLKQEIPILKESLVSVPCFRSLCCVRAVMGLGFFSCPDCSLNHKCLLTLLLCVRFALNEPIMNEFIIQYIRE